MREKSIIVDDTINELETKGELHFTPICRNCTHDVIDIAMRNSDSILVYVNCLSQEDQMYKVDIYTENVVFEELTNEAAQ